MELLCAVAGMTAGKKGGKGLADTCAAAVLVSIGKSEQHGKAVGENGHVRMELKADSAGFGGALAEIEPGKRYKVTIEEVK